MTSKPRLLDLFCGAGGCSVGYHRAGFDVVGVDLHPQPRFPYKFIQQDALDYLEDVARWMPIYGSYFDAVHASPPCQAHSTSAGKSRKAGKTYPDLIASTRELLKATGLPYVIENVAGAPLINPIRLCGTSFGLPLRRHRLFETNWPLLGLECCHGDFTERRYWTGWRPNGEHRLSTVVQVYGNGGDAHQWAEAMQIGWMAKAELAQAIPPAYTELIGHQLAQWISTEASPPADPAPDQEKDQSALPHTHSSSQHS